MKTKFIYLVQTVTLITLIGIFFSSCKTDPVEPEMEATSIAIVSGSGQSATIVTALTDEVVVIVKDQNGAAFAGVTVKFEVAEGSLSAASATTDTEGKASVSWTLGATIGTQTLTVNAYEPDGATALAGSPLQVIATGEAITVTDVNGNVYKAVIIGEQVWMAENLKATNYDNSGTKGDAIPLVTDNTAWANLGNNDTDKAYSYYNNNANGEKDTYGALYTYAAATNGVNSATNVQGICPTGWHLPNDTEWEELFTYLGGKTVAGGPMKEIGTALWDSPNAGATNSSGFTAVPGGFRFDNISDGGAFSSMGALAYWWSATQNSPYEAFRYNLRASAAWVDSFYTTKSSGFGVRCVQN